MQAFTAWLNQLNLGIVWDYVVIVAASMLCIMFHEVSHGVVALKLGDTTARDAGRLTFNPIKHVDIWGLLMMAIFRFGWAKPVPIDMRNFKHPVRDMAITAAAGPISNVILASGREQCMSIRKPMVRFPILSLPLQSIRRF